jgi:hypothetical protein
MIRSVICLAFTAGLPLSCLADSQVTEANVDPVSVYERQADGLYVRTGKRSVQELSLPLVLLEQSPRGYLKVSLKGQELWLDSMDVEVFPPPSIGKSGCVPTLQDSVAAVSRGAGEGYP